MPSTSSHARAPFRRAVQIALVVAWCALIYWFSDQPDLRVSDDDALDLVLRKSAHMVVFGVLAVLVLETLRGRGPRRRSHVAVAWPTRPSTNVWCHSSDAA